MDKIGEKMKVVFKLLLIMVSCNAFNVYGEDNESIISSTKSVSGNIENSEVISSSISYQTVIITTPDISSSSIQTDVLPSSTFSVTNTTESVFSDTSLIKEDIKKESTQTTPLERGVINLGYPYIGLGYSYGNCLYGIRGAFGNGISVYAFRISIFENSNKKTLPYIGLELGGISFDTYSLEGNGVESGIFFGLEHYISKNISFSSEFYPVFITVKSGDYRINRLEFVLNFGFNFYWRNK